jgi:DNA polymerase-3 subunit alpha
MHTVFAARTEYSVGESIFSVDDLVDKAKAAGASVIAVTDTMSVTSMIDFTNRCKKAGVKPIIGTRLRIVDDPTWRKTKEDKKRPPEYFLTCYVLSEKGMKALLRLLTLANSEDRFYFDAKLSMGDIFNEIRTESLDANDLAFASGDINGYLHHPQALDQLAMLRIALGGAGVYLSLVPVNTPYFDRINEIAIDYASRAAGLELLVTRPICYPRHDGTGAHPADANMVMRAIADNEPLLSTWCPKPQYRDLYPLDAAEMVTACKEAAERIERRRGGSVSGLPASPCFGKGLRNTAVIADKVTYCWSKQKVSLPIMAPDEYKALVEECRKGFKERLYKTTFGHQPSADELRDVYMPRLQYELGVIQKLGFSGYFLLVQDIVRYAKSNGILVGPGRGSVGGSLIAYLMGITDCDPLRFGLLFERFINPDRIDLPDIDLDFMSARTGEVIQYVVGKYGAARVSGVSNFNTLATAAAIRSVGKAFGQDDRDYGCSKFVPKLHGQNIPLAKAADVVPEIGAYRDAHPAVWNVALRLEGSIASFGSHAAGIVVGGCDLVERGVIERRKDFPAINWDKRTIEDQGLVKVDVLSLETLDVIDLALRYIRKMHSTAPDLWQIPLDDKKVLDNFAKANTTGIFQFDGGGMRRLLKELGKDGVISFDDITAATALYRPGPMESGMMDSYWRRKQGVETVDYDHPLMEPILKPTFGVMVYQEQVMQVSRTIAGYSAPDADKLRKIMGKKLPEEMKKERGKFVEGCVKTVGATEAWAGDLFDKIEGFAGYGFNKSHSVEYALISYQAMYLKTYFPVEFYAATLSLLKEDKLPGILKDANDFGITVSPPDINVSSSEFEILNSTTLCIPFGRVKGIGDNTTKAILEARAAGPFKDKADFLARVEKRRCNIGHQTKLDAIGAFARIEPGQIAPDHPDRIKDQRELIPGLISSLVPVKRDMHTDPETKKAVAMIVAEYKTKHQNDGMPINPLWGKEGKFMVISDAPTNGEDRNGQLTLSDSFQNVAQALQAAGLSRNDAYWTSMIKRPKEGKQVSAAESATYLPYLQREIEVLKPPAIVLLGSQVVRHFLPDLKGKASDSAGKVFYNKDLDVNLVIGFNPGEIYHDAEKQVPMNEVFLAVASLIAA